jgi:S1-C subfamily serine protease
MSRFVRSMVLAAWLGGFWGFVIVTSTKGRPPATGRLDPLRSAAVENSRYVWNDPPPARPIGRDEAGALVETAQRFGTAVMEVGHPRGDAGTAFVISREHRLLVTNAHVAAIFHECGGMYASAGTGGAVYRVERVWYHPGYFTAEATGSLLGYLPGGSFDSVVSRQVVPDVAVLRLAPGGPELPAEWPLAGLDELRRLETRPVGKLGFSNVRTSATSAGPLAPVFACGTVSRVCPFAPRWDVSRRWHLVDTSAPIRQGDSGGPVFLEGGRVVAVSTWNRSSLRPGVTHAAIGASAVRIDALRELLTAAGLSKLVPG